MTNPYGADPRSQPQGLGDPGNQGPEFVAPGTPGIPGQYGVPQYGPPQYGPPQYGATPGQPAPPQYGQPWPSGAPGSYGASATPGPQAYPQQPMYSQPPSSPQAPAYAQGFQQPYGPGGQPPGYGPGYTPPKRKRSAGSIVIVLVALVALVIGVSYGASQLFRGTSKPVTQASPIRPTKTAAAGVSASTRPTVSSGSSTTGRSTANIAVCTGGDKITTAAFVATVPANWSCDGDDGDISISSTQDDAIWVEHDGGTGDVSTDCQAQIADLGTVSALPPETWGGKTTVAYQAVDSGDIFGVRCAIVGGQTWYLMYFPLDATDDAAVRADVTTVMATWVWK